jgi:hypothetical protein
VSKPKANRISGKRASDPPRFILASQVPHKALMAMVLALRGTITNDSGFAFLGDLHRQQ